MTVTVPMMDGGNHIYFVGPFPMPHIKTTDKVKKRSPLLRIQSYGRPYAKMTTRRSMICSAFFTKYRVGNVVVSSRTRGRAWATATVSTIDVHGFEVTGL